MAGVMAPGGMGGSGGVPVGPDFRRLAPEERPAAMEYDIFLRELTFNSKPVINNLTMIAGENRAAANGICFVIESRLALASPDKKLPLLYLLDSIVKNIGGEFLQRFRGSIFKTFTSAYDTSKADVRASLKKLLGTWANVFGQQLCDLMWRRVHERDERESGSHQYPPPPQKAAQTYDRLDVPKRNRTDGSFPSQAPSVTTTGDAVNAAEAEALAQLHQQTQLLTNAIAETILKGRPPTPEQLVALNELVKFKMQTNPNTEELDYLRTLQTQLAQLSQPSAPLLPEGTAPVPPPTTTGAVPSMSTAGASFDGMSLRAQAPYSIPPIKPAIQHSQLPYPIQQPPPPPMSIPPQPSSLPPSMLLQKPAVLPSVPRQGYNNVHARNAFGRPQEAQAQVPTMAPAPPPASAPAPAPAPAPTLEVCDSFAKIKTASHAAAVRSLYEDLSQVCSADGSRFAKVEDMRMHFDWLFSSGRAGRAVDKWRLSGYLRVEADMSLAWNASVDRNQRKRLMQQGGISRSWYISLEAWIAGKAVDDTPTQNDVAAIFLESSKKRGREDDDLKALETTPKKKRGVTVGNSTDDEVCPVCAEKFETFWDEDEQTWMYADSERGEDGLVYHIGCLGTTSPVPGSVPISVQTSDTTALQT